MVVEKGDNILNIATKRGFFYPSAEIYNHKAGFWTYGHLGTLMKRKWENLWRSYFLSLHENFYEIEGSSILPKAAFEASGHVKNFNDPLIECTHCKSRVRADELLETAGKEAQGMVLDELEKKIKEAKIKCLRCGSIAWSSVRWFNMMFDVHIGALGEDIAYLSPETAQNPFLSFKREIMATRERLPLGLAMIGHAFRNEIAPRQGFFRLREFTQAELQIFFDPETFDEEVSWEEVKDVPLRVALVKDKGKTRSISCGELHRDLKLPKFYLYYAAKIHEFYHQELSIPIGSFRFREISDSERAFYNKIHFDGELELETLGGFKEVCGLHYRGDHDLHGHQDHSKEKLEVMKDGKKVLPHVLELSFGVDRNIWALLDLFYHEEKERTYFSFPYNVTPFDTTIFPLVQNDEKLVKKAREIYDSVRKNLKTFYDQSGSIGRRYRRAEEVGIPCMITVDFQTLEDKTVTLRSRDTMKQIRVPTAKLLETVHSFLSGADLEKLGKVIQ